MVAKLAEPGYALELTSAVPSVGLVSIVSAPGDYFSGLLILLLDTVALDFKIINK